MEASVMTAATTEFLTRSKCCFASLMVVLLKAVLCRYDAG